MKSARMIKKIMNFVIISSMILMSFGRVTSPARAANMLDGTWARSGTDVVTFTTIGLIPIGGKIILTFSQEGAVNTVTTNCRIDARASDTVGVDTTRKTFTYTIGGTSLAAGSHNANNCQLVTTFNPSNYKAHTVAVNTVDAAGAAIDWGVATTYNGTAGGLGVAVNVTASVPQYLNMNLSKTAIDLGVLSITALSTDSHTITINTNDTAGYLTRISSSGNLQNAALDPIAPIAEGSQVNTPGVEAYGIGVTAGGGATEVPDFDDDDTPIPVGAASFISFADATASAHVHTVTYKATIASGTEAGNYTQTVYYTVATN